jgi:iron(III) transport system permease protein
MSATANSVNPSASRPGLLASLRHAALFRRKALVSLALAVLLALMVITPIGALIWQSLFDEKTGEFTAKAYTITYGSSTTWTAVKNTLLIIGIVEVVAVVVGTALAWLLTACDLPARRWLMFIPLFPLLFPPLLSALGWIFLLTPGVGFVNVGLRSLFGMTTDTGPLSIYSMLGIGWVMGIYSVPYVYAVVAPALENLDTRLDEAAKMCGATTAECFWTITVKLVAPAIAGGALFAFVVSASEFTIPLLIGTRAHIDLVSTRLYELVTGFPVQFNQGAALAMGLLGAVAAVTALQRWITTRRSYATIGGKGSRRELVKLGRWRWLIAALIVGYLAVTVIVPLLAIVVVSFLPFWKVGEFSFTLSNYEYVLFKQVGTGAAFVNSALLAVAGATLSVILALFVVHVTLRNRTRINALLETVAGLPLGVPSIVFGTGMLIVFLHSPIALYGTLFSLLVAYVAHSLPITLRPVSASYVQLDGALLESAYMSGASGSRTMVDVVLPLLRGGIISAWGLTFVILLREMPISIMLATPGNNVISTYLFTLYDSQTFPAVAALAVVIFLVSAAGLAVIFAAARLWRPAAGVAR